VPDDAPIQLLHLHDVETTLLEMVGMAEMVVVETPEMHCLEVVHAMTVETRRSVAAVEASSTPVVAFPFAHLPNAKVEPLTCPRGLTMETLDPMMLPMAPWPKEMVQASHPTLHWG